MKTRNLWIGLSTAALLGLLTQTALALDRTAFCERYNGICKRTGGNESVCNGRRDSCMSSGCFHFNTGGSQCMSSAAAVKKVEKRRTN
jgi:hypothetical protein